MSKKEVEVVLFGLKHEGDLLRTYPELAKMEEFKDLDPNKVKFCWLVGNITSPIFKMERSSRIKKALRLVWGETYGRNPSIKEIVRATEVDPSGESMPDDIMLAIRKMNTFDPSYRLKAKLMAEYIFEALNELVVVDPNEMAMMDVDDKKKYADLVIKVSSELNGMVERIESSYGVKTVDRQTKKEIQVNINDIMH